MLAMETAISLLLISTLATNGLVALLAAAWRGHWFPRTTVVLAGPAMLLLAPAYELTLTLVCQSLVVIVGTHLIRSRTALPKGEVREPRPDNGRRFSLSGLLLTTPLVAAAAAVMVRIPWDNRRLVQSIVVVAVCSGLATLLGAWGARRLNWRDAVGVIGAVVIGGVILAIPAAWFDWFALSLLDFTIGWPPKPSTSSNLLALLVDVEEHPVILWFVAMPCIALATMAMARLAVVAMTAAPAPRKAGRLKWPARASFAALSIALVAPSVAAWYRLSFPDPIPQVELPTPNGHDDFAAAGEMVQSRVFQNAMVTFEEMTDTLPKLKQVVQDAAPALERVRLGLSRESMTPADYTSEELDDEIQFMMGARNLARTLVGEGRLASLANRNGDAMLSHLDAVRLGMALRRGGMLIDMIVGMNCAKDGVDGLRQLRTKLTPAQRRAAIEILTPLYDAMEPASEYLYRDRLWEQHSTGWHGRMEMALGDATDEYVLFEPATYQQSCSNEQVWLRLLILELALLNLAEEQGGPPVGLADLPLSNRELLVDPFARGGEEIKYEQRRDGYLLYSVGVNGVDEQGAPPAEGDEWLATPQSGDLQLDAMFERSDE